MPRAITLRTCQRRLKVDSEKLFERRSETTLPRACAMHGVVVVEDRAVVQTSELPTADAR